MNAVLKSGMLFVVASLFGGSALYASTISIGHPGDSSPTDRRPVASQNAGATPRGTAVLNVDTSQTFATIQAAIDDPNTLAGHTIEVQALAHSEGLVTISKSITLRGASGSEVVTATTNTGSSGDARAWFLVPAGIVATVENLTFDGDSGSGRLVYQAFRVAGSGSFDHCTFQNIRYNIYTGVAVVPFGDGPVNISNCTFTNIQREGVLYYGSGVNGSVYSNNTYTGKGVGDFLDYGVEAGGGAVVTIQDSTITGCRGVASSDGSTSAGVLATTFFAPNTEATVTGCFLNGNTRGLFVGYDASDTTVASIANSNVSGNTDEGVISVSSTVLTDASANWWGSNIAATVATRNSGMVDYTPWLVSGTDVGGDPSDGFDGDFSALSVDDDSPQSGPIGRIQEGVNLVTASTVNVLPGTYEEQVVITTNNLQLLGSGSGTNPAVDSIIQSPVSLTYSFNSGTNDNYPVIGVEGVTGVTIDNIRIDGLGRASGNYRFLGIGYWNAGGTVNSCRVTGIRETPLNGAQHGVGILVDNDTGGPYTMNVSGTTIDDYQKNGMALLGTGLTVSLSDCTTIGSGATTLIAQNGIEIGFGAGGTVDDCHVSNNLYTVGTYASTGFLLYNATNMDVTNSSATDNFPGVWFLNTNGSFDGGAVTNLSPDSVDGFYIYNDTAAFRGSTGGGRVLPVASPFETAVQDNSERSLPPQTVTVSNSTFIGHGGTGTWGIAAYASGTATASLTVNTSTIRNWDWGVVAYNYGGPISLTANYNQIYDNTTWGFYSDLPGVQDAEYNWWGDATGPEDLLGTDEAENPPCFDPLTMVNANGLGNAVSNETVDYCPWLGGPAVVALNADADCYSTVGDIVTVSIDASSLTTNIVGGQFFMSYDTAVLDFVGAVPGDALFTELFESVNEVAGTIDYAVNAPFGDPGTSADVSMAEISFVTLVETCDAADLVTFRPHAPPTRLSDFGGGEVSPLLEDLGAISVDETIPVVSGLTVTGGDVDTNCETLVTFSATVTDNCCIMASDVSVGVTLPTANATLGAPNVVITQIDAVTVSITGDVLVSDLTSCPATVQVTVNAMDCCGNAAATAMDSDDVNDITAPVITCPADITVNADAGGCTAAINPGMATATDNCDGSPDITWVRSDGAGSLTDPYDSADSPITITWTATDACNNIDQCMQTITVNAFNDLVVTVQLSPNIDTDNPLPDTLSRCITFELWECAGPSSVTVSAVVDFTVNAGIPNTAIGTATIDVPCGFYNCITARDTLHTLRRTDEAFGISGTQYVADFTGDVSAGGDWLIGGNLNDDFYIDILDFGVFSAQFSLSFGTGDTTCSTPAPHSDISGDGEVDSFDFSFIQINFLKSNEPNCCGAPLFRMDGEEDQGPVTEISVQELRRRGLGHLSVGDLNGDGLLNVEDMAAFADGARPSTQRRAVSNEGRLRE